MSENGKSAGPIRIFNRAKGVIETESVYGERFLRWACETAPGRLSVALLVKRALFSKWYGWRMDRRASARKIAPFISEYRLDAGEFELPVDAFRSFNDFFVRRLKPEARPVDPDPESVVFPADGRHLAIENLDSAPVFYAKGQRFDLAGFLGDADLARSFEGGALLISRLCPIDYHRFHFPVSGLPGCSILLPGSLRSVSPIALRQRLSILWENRRCLTRVCDSRIGDYLIVEIGATCVGRIRQTFKPEVAASKGEEKGFFGFGGSCVVTVFPKGAVRFDDDLLEQSGNGIETFARMGGRCAQNVQR